MQVNSLDTLVKLLCSYTEPVEGNSDLVKCLPSIPNLATNNVELRFSGWNIKLHPNGTWTLADTGGCLK